MSFIMPSSISTTFATSRVTSVPFLTAIPTFAFASAGESLMPSPTIATVRPKLPHDGGFFRGQHFGMALVDPDLPRDFVRHLRIVAGKHDHGSPAAFAQPADHVRHFRPYFVGIGYEPG
jgi:hypothetical protein